MRFLLSIILLFTVLLSNAQQIDELKEEVNNAEQEINRINKLLDSNREQQNKSNERVRLLERRLSIRQNLVKNTNKIISSLESQLNSCDIRVLSSEKKIDSIKTLLSASCREINKFSYLDFNQQDNLDLLALTSKCNSQISELDSLIKLTGVTRSEISNKKMDLEHLQSKRKKEVEQIISETEQLESIRFKLKSRESMMLAQIESQRSKINNLQREIQRLISLDNANNPVADESFSSGFLSMKGKFPSPLAVKGSIISEYGTHSHPTISGVKVSNTGVNVAFTGSSDVYSIADGEVRGVYSIAGMANTVLIRHGKYISVYANLSSVNVSKGDKVTSRQKIGNISSNDDNSDLFLHFELWHESKTLNPVEWVNFN